MRLGRKFTKYCDHFHASAEWEATDRKYHSPESPHGLQAALIYLIKQQREKYAKARFTATVDFPTPPLQLFITRVRGIQPAYSDDVADMLQVFDLVMTIRHESRRTLRFDVDIHFHWV